MKVKQPILTSPTSSSTLDADKKENSQSKSTKNLSQGNYHDCYFVFLVEIL